MNLFRIFAALLIHISACVAQDEFTPLPAELLFDPRYDPALDSGAYGQYPIQNYFSTKTKAPRFNFLNWTSECFTHNDFYFITPKGWKVPNPGPMIFDYRGELVWAQHFDNEFGGQAYDLMVQEYLGEKFLTFWLGDDRIRGHGSGQFHMINPAYDEIHQIGSDNGRSADLHEFVLTPQGTALIVVFEPIRFDVRPAGREFDDVWNQVMWDCLIQEVAIATKEVVFEWRASEHLDIAESYHGVIDRSDGTPEHPYDPFHFNSVDKDDLGNYLVSARYSHAIYYISGSTKEVIWTLGGKNNKFMDLSASTALNFAWQHDARFISPDAFPEIYTPPEAKEGVTTKLLTLFDNAAEDWHYQFGPESARGLLLEITYPSPAAAASKEARDLYGKEAATSDTTLSKLDADKAAAINGSDPAYTVRLIQEYSNSETGRASSQGSMQLVTTEPGKDPHILLGHGINAIISEYSSNGSLLCDIHFGARSSWEKGDVQSYRALKFRDWVGRPHVPPDVAVDGTNVYVSWNGATGVAEWVLQTSDGGEEDRWLAANVVKKDGFETKIEIPKDRRKARYLRVTALDGNGHTCEHGVSDAYKRGYIYGHQRQTGAKSSAHVLMWGAGSLIGFLLFIRIVRRCYARWQRRRSIARWKLP